MNLESEIRVNRALLWLILAYEESCNGAGRPTVVLTAALSALSFISAYMIWRESDDS